MRKIFFLVVAITWLGAGCAGPNQAVTERGTVPPAGNSSGHVTPGMERQEVIVSLGPPMVVTRKTGQDTEFLVYHLSGSTEAGGETAPLYIAIDNGKVTATGSASDFGLDR